MAMSSGNGGSSGTSVTYGSAGVSSGRPSCLHKISAYDFASPLSLRENSCRLEQKLHRLVMTLFAFLDPGPHHLLRLRTDDVRDLLPHLCEINVSRPFFFRWGRFCPRVYCFAPVFFIAISFPSYFLSPPPRGRAALALSPCKSAQN